MTRTAHVSVGKMRAKMKKLRVGTAMFPAAGGFLRLKKEQPITVRRVDEMEVRLPLAWKSHPVLIDPHPPPSLYRRLRALLPSFSLASLMLSLKHRRCFIPLPPPLSDTSLASASLIAPSLFASVRPLSLRLRSPLFLLPPPFSPHRPRRRLVSLAKKFTFAKKREKGAKNRFATPIRRVRPGPRRHWSAARSWAWLKDELSLCHRLYWSYTIRCVRSTHRRCTHTERHGREPPASGCTSPIASMHTYVHGASRASRHLQRMHCARPMCTGWLARKPAWLSVSARKRYRSISPADIISMTSHRGDAISDFCYLFGASNVPMLSIKMLRGVCLWRRKCDKQRTRTFCCVSNAENWDYRNYISFWTMHDEISLVNLPLSFHDYSNQETNFIFFLY